MINSSSGCTVKGLKDWLAQLPPEFEDAPIESLPQSGSFPTSAKRIVAFRLKGDGKPTLAVNSMGSHIPDDFYTECEIIGYLTWP